MVATIGSAGVRVTPGVAVDGAGTHIVLAAGGSAELSEHPDQVSLPGTVTADGVTVSTSARDRRLRGHRAVPGDDRRGRPAHRADAVAAGRPVAPGSRGAAAGGAGLVLTLDDDEAVLAAGDAVGDRARAHRLAP